MKNSLSFIAALSVLGLTINAHSKIQLSGYFIARDECPAYQSFHRQTNPGDVTS